MGVLGLTYWDAGPPGYKESHRGEHLLCGFSPRSLPGPGGTLHESRSFLATQHHPYRRPVNGPRMDALANSSLSVPPSDP